MLWLALASPAAAEDRKEAARLFGAGEKAFKMADYDSAAQSFEAAYAAFPAPEIAFSAAQAYRLGNSLLPRPRADYVKRAIELYELYVERDRRGGRVADAAVHLQALRAIWRELEGSGAGRAAKPIYDRTQLTVWVEVEGAEITIDDEETTAYAYVDVEPGEHVVAVDAEGYFPYEQKVSVAKGAQVPVSVELRAMPATLRIDTEAGAEISLDGRPVALVDGEVQTAAGRRWLAISRAGRVPRTQEVVLTPGGELSLRAPLTATTRRKAARWVMWGTSGLLAVTAGATAVAFVADARAVEERERVNQPSDRAYEIWRGRRDTFRAIAFASGTLTLAAAATAGFLYFSDHARGEPSPLRDGGDRERRPQFTPMVSIEGRGAGVALRGGF